MMEKYITLAVLLNVCHWLGDFVFTFPRLISAKKYGNPAKYILYHAGIHSLLMGVVLYFFTDNIILLIDLVLFQFISHSIIDVLKAKLNKFFPSILDPTNKWHWIIFGFDQLAHNVVIITMVYFVIQNIIHG